MRCTIKTTLVAALAVAGIGIGAAPVAEAGAVFVDLPPQSFPAVDPCTDEAVTVTMTSRLQAVESRNHTTLIFRSTTSATDGSSGRGIETRQLRGDSYDINLRLMVSNPDGHRYTIVSNLKGVGDPVFAPPTLTCIRRAK